MKSGSTIRLLAVTLLLALLAAAVPLAALAGNHAGGASPFRHPLCQARRALGRLFVRTRTLPPIWLPGRYVGG